MLWVCGSDMGSGSIAWVSGFRYRVQGLGLLCLGFRAVKDSGLSTTRNGAFVMHVHFRDAFECGDVISRSLGLWSLALGSWSLRCKFEVRG